MRFYQWKLAAIYSASLMRMGGSGQDLGEGLALKQLF